MNRYLIFFKKTLLSSILFIVCFIGNNPIHAIEKRNPKQGERYFYGMLPHNSSTQSCVSCHYIAPCDSFRWEPSVQDLATKTEKWNDEQFLSVMNSPTGKIMTKIHQDISLDDEAYLDIRAFLASIHQSQYHAIKPSIDKIILFFLLGFIITWALVDLLFIHKIKYKQIPSLILLLCLLGQGYMIYKETSSLGKSKGYAPDQPIKFSHKVHAKNNKIDCKYCHGGVEKGKSAGIPSTELCMNCHSLVREGSYSGKYEISKIVDAWEKKKSISWQRLHVLPDHVYFNHSQHVGVAKLDCVECHGDVQNMDLMVQSEDLSMGWCIKCHRESTCDYMKDNEYYSKILKAKEAGEISLRDSLLCPEDQGSNDCMKCHY